MRILKFQAFVNISNRFIYVGGGFLFYSYLKFIKIGKDKRLTVLKIIHACCLMKIGVKTSATKYIFLFYLNKLTCLLNIEGEVSGSNPGHTNDFKMVLTALVLVITSLRKGNTLAIKSYSSYLIQLTSRQRGYNSNPILSLSFNKCMLMLHTIYISNINIPFQIYLRMAGKINIS